MEYTAEFYHVPPLIDYALFLVMNCYIPIRIKNFYFVHQIVDLYQSQKDNSKH